MLSSSKNVYQSKYAEEQREENNMQMSILSRILEALFKCQSEIGCVETENASLENNSQQMWLISEVNLEYFFKYSFLQLPFCIVLPFQLIEGRWVGECARVFSTASCLIVKVIKIIKYINGLSMSLYSVFIDTVLTWPVGCFHLQVSVLPRRDALTSPSLLIFEYKWAFFYLSK